ncbi:hypothetical protein ABK040_003823 [Willaertia magna]
MESSTTRNSLINDNNKRNNNDNKRDNKNNTNGDNTLMADHSATTEQNLNDLVCLTTTTSSPTIIKNINCNNNHNYNHNNHNNINKRISSKSLPILYNPNNNLQTNYYNDTPISTPTVEIIDKDNDSDSDIKENKNNCCNFFQSIRFILPITMVVTIIISIILISIIWISCFAASLSTFAEKNKRSEFYQLKSYILKSIEEIRNVGFTMANILQIELDFNNSSRIEHLMYQFFMSEYRARPTTLVAIYCGDEFANTIGVVKLGEATKPSALYAYYNYSLTPNFVNCVNGSMGDGYINIYECNNFENLNYCNRTNVPTSVLKTFEMAACPVAMNGTIGNVTWLKSYEDPAFPGIVFLTLTVSFLTSDGKKAWVAYDISIDTFSTYLKNSVQELPGALSLVIETQNNYIIASNEQEYKYDAVLTTTTTSTTTDNTNNNNNNAFINSLYSLFEKNMNISRHLPDGKAKQITSDILSKFDNSFNNLKYLDSEIIKTTLSQNFKIYELNEMQNSFKSMLIALKSVKKFVPVKVLENILRSNKEAKLILEPANVTIMFLDIENFTTIAETTSPNDLVNLVGIVFEICHQSITKYEGVIDKYIGDCVMALWNVPSKVLNHEYKACQAAIEIQRILFLKKIKTRIGINTDIVLAGNIGSKERFSFSVIGDGVNFASRLESTNKFYKTLILISSTTFLKAKEFEELNFKNNNNLNNNSNKNDMNNNIKRNSKSVSSEENDSIDGKSDGNIPIVSQEMDDMNITALSPISPTLPTLNIIEEDYKNNLNNNLNNNQQDLLLMHGEDLFTKKLINRRVDNVVVKGKKKAKLIYQLYYNLESLNGLNLNDLEIYEKAFDYFYIDKDLQKSLKLFNLLYDKTNRCDLVIEKKIKRIQEILEKTRDGFHAQEFFNSYVILP